MCSIDSMKNMGQNMGIPQQSTAVPPPPSLTISQSIDTRDYSNKYNTSLSTAEEAKYGAWATKNGRGKDSYDYDMRGAWKEMQTKGNLQSSNGHFPDTYKKPNHPTFSDQSKYNGSEGKMGGKWGNENGVDTFTPGKGSMFKAEELQRYFQKVEPKAKLYAPGIDTK